MNSNQNKLVIIDLSNLIFRAFFAIRHLSAPDKTPVNAVYGVLQMLIKIIEEQKPQYFIVAQDSKEKSFRQDLYAEYKANRSAPPEELIPQFALIEELLDLLELKRIKVPGFEADDIISTLVNYFSKSVTETYIVTSDKDLMQLVNQSVFVYDTMKEKKYDAQAVKEKMGVYPEQIVDFLALVGDSSDNIPGVSGIGTKGAQKLLEKYNTLENILNNPQIIENKKLATAIETDRASAILSKSLVVLKNTIPISEDLTHFNFIWNPTNQLKDFLLKLGFKSSIQKIFSNNDHLINPTIEINSPEKIISLQEISSILLLENSIHVGCEFKNNELILYSNNQYSVILPNDFSNLKIKPDHIFVMESSKEFIKVWLNSSQTISKLPIFFDLQLACFCLTPDESQNWNNIIRELPNHQIPVLEPEIWYKAKTSLELYPIILEKLNTQNVETTFFKIDIPLLPVLAKMEMTGIKIDLKILEELKVNFSKELNETEVFIKREAHTEINLKSPKQVGELLFEKLGLPIIKMNKTGPSTDSNVLEKLDLLKLSPIPKELLKFRELEKLLSTYIIPLPEMIHSDGRIHTHFKQNGAATGRLSSENPNLQNIPIRTDRGSLLRKAFVAGNNKILLGADYSQIELRILAHFCQDPFMIKAFQDNIDIHCLTASEIFQISPDSVTKEQRSKAKAINFGLIYGQTSFGLSEALKISQAEAKKYITFYFNRFSQVKVFLDSLKELAEKNGYSETLFGRKRILNGIRSQNRIQKSLAERMAINTPIQGTAADLIKIAMLNIAQEINEKKLSSKIILQIHDELIFELPPEESEELEKIVKYHMENVINLRVPLKVEMGTGRSWYEI